MDLGNWGGPWALIHGLGGFFLVYAWSTVLTWTPLREGRMLLAALLLAWGCGWAWEGLDAAFAGQWIFDADGWSWGDILVDAAGCLLAPALALLEKKL